MEKTQSKTIISLLLASITGAEVAKIKTCFLEV